MEDAARDPGLPTKEDQYRMVRSQFEHEEQILNQRVIWFVFTQSFLYTGYAIALNAPEKSGIRFGIEMQQALVWVLPIVAFASGIAAFLAVIGSLMTRRDLRRYFDTFQGRPSDGRETHYPPLQGSMLTHRLGVASAMCLPLVFIFTWLVLLIRQCMA